MRTMILTALALLTAGLAACMPDLTGIEEASQYGQTLVSAARVGSVRCDADTVYVGQSTRCAAYSPAGTRLSVDGVSVVVWSTIDPEILESDLGGVVTGISEGRTSVRAIGSYMSVGYATVVVLE